MNSLVFKLRSIFQALESLKKNKLRTFLTVLGVVIGISAVIIVISAGQSIKAYILEQLEVFGSDTIEIEVKVPNTVHTSSENAGGMVSGITITTLKTSDAEAIKKINNIKEVYTGLLGQELISYKNENKRTILWGTNESFIRIDKGRVAEGEFFTKDDEDKIAQVAVIGSKIKDRFFPNDSAIGKNIKIKGKNFRVVGVMESRGAVMTFDFDEIIFLPVQTLQKKVMGIDHITFILASVHNTNQIDSTVDEITLLIRERHGITDSNKDDFAVLSMQEAMKMVDVVFNGIQIILIAIASISLIVGGVGIMNIMYVNVNQRTYEIGLRKAIGATSRNILYQFLWEAIFVTFLGGVIGILFGIASSYVIALVARMYDFDWRFIISAGSIFLACGFSITVGVLFGLYPAKKAAKMDPVEALRFK